MQISKFTSAFSNFQRSNLYRVDFSFKNFQPSDEDMISKVALLCKEASFPFPTFNVAETFINGTKRSTVQQADYDPVSLTFMIDTDGNIMNFLKEWVSVIKNNNHNFGFRDDYIGEITINMLDQKTSDLLGGLDLLGNTGNIATNNIKKYRNVADRIGGKLGLDTSILNNLEANEIVTSKVILKNAFIVNIDEIALSYESNDEISTVTVSFNYDYADYGITKKAKSLSDIGKFLPYAQDIKNIATGGLNRPNIDKILAKF